jgi:hypothetical protein
MLAGYQPRAAWWARRDAVGGIHGLSHCARVLLWADHVATRLRADGVPVDVEVVRWAAACHDCRRHDEGMDAAHGQRAAQWFGQHATRLAPSLTPAQVTAVQYAVEWHVPHDRHCPEMVPELKALKDADGLDRVRLGDFDARYLRTPYLHGCVDHAEALYDASHPGRVDDPWALVSAAARRLGLG